MLKACLVNYNYDPAWLLEYPDLDTLIYDRSDDGIERNLTQYGKVFKTENKGNVDFDKLSFLIDNYYNLPDVFLWGKTNLHKYVDAEQMQKLTSFTDFTPLQKTDHKVYSDRIGPVCFYSQGIYHERNDSWYVNELGSVHFQSFNDFARKFYLPSPPYIPFAPGGNYILTRERVHRYGVNFYEEMRKTLPYSSNPAEAHMCERSYYLLWK